MIDRDLAVLAAAFIALSAYIAGWLHGKGRAVEPRVTHLNNNDIARLHKRLRERDARLRVVRAGGDDSAA